MEEVVLGKYLDLYRTILRTFGFRLRPVGTFGLIQLRHLISGTTRLIDEVAAPEYRRQPLDRPVFILGNPRSGTTFVHRFLLNTEQLCAFELWEMLFPAITARKMLGGMVDRLAPVSPARYHSSDAHETSLRDVETDDVLEFFRFIDGGFLWSYFWAWEDTWGSELSRKYFELEEQPPAETERLFSYLESCWKRNMQYKKRERIIVKSSIMTMRVPTLLKRYPDCKLIYLSRDPIQTIPSGMSLLTGVLEQSYDLFHATSDEKRARYLENLYQGSLQVYRSFEKFRQAGIIPEKNLRIVRYEDLMTNLNDVMSDLVEFLELSPTEEFWDKVRKQDAKQKERKSSHAYSLEKFGLDEERIRKDLAFYYEQSGKAPSM